MPDLMIYRVFISHACVHDEEYKRLVKMLDKASFFYWQNYSLPINDALARPTGQEFHDRMALTNIVIVLSGDYCSHIDFMQQEIEIAADLKKPILGIMPWRNQNVPHIVKELATEIVGWNTNSIVDAIRRLYI